jgi:outer membrane protein assembly factor BamB
LRRPVSILQLPTRALSWLRRAMFHVVPASRAGRVVASLGVGAIILVAAGGGLWAWNGQRTGDIRGSADQEFVATETPEIEVSVDQPVAEPSSPQPSVSIQPAVEAESSVEAPVEETVRAPLVVVPEPPSLRWPTWGLGPSRTRVVPDEFSLKPPFREVWRLRGKSLIEFPPAIADGQLFVGTNKGRFIAADTESGDINWEVEFGRCIAASPAVDSDLVYVALMDPWPCRNHDESAPGYIVALDAATGEERWRFASGVTETSPLVVDGTLYFGAWDHNVYALDAESGEKLWSYETGDQVKSAVAWRNGTVYSGSYDGRMYALDAGTGELKWATSGRSGLFSSGRFYSTPALAYGRVYVGNIDGRVYAFGADSGEVIWSRTTDGFVYSSPAVFDETVYVGSYDGNLYAFDAVSGDTRWSFAAGDAISGSPTVMGGLVYFSTFGRKTFAVDATTGERVWTFDDGEYTPLVTDGKRAYIVGLARVYALEPVDANDDGAGAGDQDE